MIILEHAFYKIILVFLLCISIDILASNSEKTYVPRQGYVPNEETAIKIAEAIWYPIYGKVIYDSKPFVAKLSKDKKKWIVSGTVHTKKGGAPYAEIRKMDCKILRVSHGE